MYSAYNLRPLVLPSPNPSVDQIFESLSDSDAEFTLFEGSSESFAWSNSQISVERDSSSESHPTREPTTVDPSAPSSLGARPIPLMAFLAFLLAVDDTTLHLLEHPHPNTHSPLFPGPSLAHPLSEQDSPDPQHGLFRLLGSGPRALRDGVTVALDSAFVPSNPFATSPFHILHSWVKTLTRQQ